MKAFDDLKNEIRISVDGKANSKYAAFLDLLVAPANDRRGTDKRWDLWYFSDNTDFCRMSARSFLEQVKAQGQEFLKLHKEEDNQFTFERIRRHFGCFSFYLYAALESFSHETNILYGLEMPPKKVSITAVLENLPERSGLRSHLDVSLEHPTIR
ncbi:MAG TPA: hypothetical protein VFW33_06055, partial [Gemmataceae bacterium]|nr:hypothetical protein [Gemmataceae bacterium]